MIKQNFFQQFSIGIKNAECDADFESGEKVAKKYQLKSDRKM
jgi:hypothetical protein